MTSARGVGAGGVTQDVVVETLRSIAELMIWGDQHNPSFFDFFLEKQVRPRAHWGAARQRERESQEAEHAGRHTYAADLLAAVASTVAPWAR